MSPPSFLPLGLMLCFALSVLPARAQETVTIPKARLEELERKEKELDALKLELGKARGETKKLQRAKEQAEREKTAAERERAKAEKEAAQLTKAKEAAEAKAEQERAKAESERAKAELEAAQLTKAKEAAEAKATAAAGEPVIAHDTPPLAGLPPLKKGDVVNAMDLMNHYRADPVDAAKRYGKQRTRVRGVITGFDKPIFITPYVLYLQTTERIWRIECVVSPPEEFKSVYPAKHGETLVGNTRSGAQLTLARVGQTVEIEGACKGLNEQILKLSACQLKATE